jgi:hypothetical protein
MLDYSEYIHTDWRSTAYMGTAGEKPACAILLCEFSIMSNHGLDLMQSVDRYDPSHIKHYLCFESPPTEEDIFSQLALRLDTIPSWYTSWWSKLQDITLDPPHYKEERMMCLSQRYNNQEEIWAARTHKEVLEVDMIEAWLFSMSGDMFSATIAPREINCNDLHEGMPGGKARSFWALKEPTPLTKGEAA